MYNSHVDVYLNETVYLNFFTVAHFVHGTYFYGINAHFFTTLNVRILSKKSIKIMVVLQIITHHRTK